MEFFETLFGAKQGGHQDLFQQEVMNWGTENKDKTIYYIKDKNVTRLGFFALYRRWLDYLYFADICGYVPVIYTDSGFAYKEKRAVHNTTNPFEYYFVQPAGISVEEARHSNRVVLSNHIHRKMVELILTGGETNYKYTNRYMLLMARVAAKYIKFNPHTQSYIEESLTKINFKKDKMLGVHMRGTDYREMYNDHPVYVTEDECFLQIDRVLDKGMYDRIFLATDDERILEKFIHRYGDRLCFYEDVKRSRQNKSIAFHQSTREQNKYLLGLEVIRDMYTLSMCTGLVAGVSQVAICAQIHKMSKKEKYVDKVIIDKGVYSNQKFFRKRVW